MDDLRQIILETLGEQFSLAMEGMLGEKWPATLPADPMPADSGRSLCWSQKFNFHKDPLLQVVADAAVWREIGTRALVAVGIEEPEESDVRATYLELLTQALSGLARYLTSKAGNEITLESGAESSLPASGGKTPFRCVRLSSPGGFEANVYVRVEPNVMEALLRQGRPVEDPASEAEAEQPKPQRAVAVAASAGAGQSTPPSPSMDLLLDVEMPVSVSFGRTQLALKEVIKLSTGSIIELNRTISEPVEVIVNNCVVARGEVVVVEGNYGVRIQQIISRADRLKSVD